LIDPFYLLINWYTNLFFAEEIVDESKSFVVGGNETTPTREEVLLDKRENGGDNPVENKT
jgi:hypothetical protein